MHHISDLPKTEELYPMLSSTAAKSKMSLTCAQSYPCNLAFECVKILNDISRANIKGIDFSNILVTARVIGIIEFYLAMFVALWGFAIP